MASRHEEKFLIDYRQYSVVRARAEAAMRPDPNSADGSYLITSVYYDDHLNTALDEKLDGVKVHTKYRIRTYDCNPSPVNLERKVKRGIMTEKFSAKIDRSTLDAFADPATDLEAFGGRTRVMATEMRAKGLFPVITVRYKRDAFVYPEADVRLTFDTNVEALLPDFAHLFDDAECGVPALPRNVVIMEVKYGEYLPAFVRKLASCDAMQLSVSKYALCREVLK